MQETQVWYLGWEDPLEKEMATHSSVLAWKIPWMEEPGGLQSMRLQRVRHNWATNSPSYLYLHVSFWKIQELNCNNLRGWEVSNWWGKILLGMPLILFFLRDAMWREPSTEALSLRAAEMWGGYHRRTRDEDEVSPFKNGWNDKCLYVNGMNNMLKQTDKQAKKRTANTK